LAELCGLGVKTNQATQLGQLRSSMASPGSAPMSSPQLDAQGSAALTRSFLDTTGPGKFFSDLFAKREPGNWDEMLQWGGDASSRGDYARAEKYLRMAMDTAEAQDPNDIRVATAASYLANVETKALKFGEAERLYRKALAIDERHLSPKNPDVVQMRQDLADVLRHNGKSQEAAKLAGHGATATRTKAMHGQRVTIAQHKSARMQKAKASGGSSQGGFSVVTLLQN